MGLTVTVPNIVIGIDVETKSMRTDAYIVAVGAAAIDIPTLRLIGCAYQTIDPNDESAKRVFHEDPGTMAWWRGEGENPAYAPSPEAYKEAFSGTLKMPEALWALNRFLMSYKNEKVVMTMRGPDFDAPILLNAFLQCDVPVGLLRRFSALDSDRTAERLMAALGFEIEPNAEAHNWIGTQANYLHHAGVDATKEAYTTARAYHLALITKRYGYERACAANEQLRTGDYRALEFLKND